MLIRKTPGLTHADVTPKAVFLNRRKFLRNAGLAGAAAFAGRGFWDLAFPSSRVFAGSKLNVAFKSPFSTTEKQNAYDDVTHYNNYYEFGVDKTDPAKNAQILKTYPWTVSIEGEVKHPRQITIDEILKLAPLEERIYRHRCVEAWSMTVPWSGFAMKALVDFAKPASGAKYVQLTSFQNPDVADGQKASWYPWPYIEGLTMAEATHDLAFMVTGAYGKPAPKQNGAPLRLATPWKYGFKSAKGLGRFTFTDKQPMNFWQAIQASEYGFWANVNPAVPHPRWSQATERVLGTDERVPTLLFNGYGEYVADIYKGLQNERLYA